MKHPRQDSVRQNASYFYEKCFGSVTVKTGQPASRDLRQNQRSWLDASAVMTERRVVLPASNLGMPVVSGLFL